MTHETALMNSIRPISPVAGYVGGKRQLAKHLTALIRETPHSTYAEAFVGMGGVFFKRDQKTKG
jgi:DNA adenine methylase